MSNAEQDLAYIRKRFPSRENLERIRAAIMVSSDMQGGDDDDLLRHVETFYDVRHRLYPEGRRERNASRHWPREMDDTNHWVRFFADYESEAELREVISAVERRLEEL